LLFFSWEVVLVRVCKMLADARSVHERVHVRTSLVDMSALVYAVATLFYFSPTVIFKTDKNSVFTAIESVGVGQQF